jgi:hypothetical protein
MGVEVKGVGENGGSIGLIDAPFGSQCPLGCECLRLGSRVVRRTLGRSFAGDERHRQLGEGMSLARDLERLAVAKRGAVELKVTPRPKVVEEGR